MMIRVTKHVEFHRPGTPITFSVPAKDHPQLLPHDVRDHILSIGAGHVVPSHPGQRNGGIAAFIARKRNNR